MFNEKGPKPVKDTYSSGMTPQAMPKSNHNMVYSKSVYDSKYMTKNNTSAHKGMKVANVGNKSMMQPKDLSKTKFTNKEKAPSLAHALKDDKYAA